MKSTSVHSKTSAWLLAAVLVTAAFPGLAENGITDRKIVLGQSAAFSGPAAQLGIQLNVGAKAYFDHVNASGGVFGRKIELIKRDDQYEADLAAKNTKSLIETDEVFALFGYVGTPTSNAALPIFTQARVPFFAPFSGAQSLREPFNRLIFNVRASYYDETEHLVDRLVSTGLKNIAVFYQNDAYGKAGLAGVERALKKLNLPIVDTATVERNSIDVSKAVDKLLIKRPDVIIQISAYGSSAALIRQMRARSYTGQFMNVSFVGSQALAETLGKDGPGVVISQVVPFPWSSASAAVVGEYSKIMNKAGINDLNFSSLEGYIDAKIFVEGLRRAGQNLTREKFISALETINMRSYDGGGFDVSFSPSNHNGSKYVDMTVISKDGKFRD
ncbi:MULTISPECIES: ABC transporter substrate-binding protein [unclassified Undibacterium]|uniref:ABC transporter substrate-binding protein n=2 Tax=Pseudomonadati TaxID=3379134 RepID=UPI002AC9CC9D|nr:MULTISPECIES: ABC transporter substrate-binding protein [unclassified Undibacterium]MEB0140364.1 ABC transporter substrate-binding protein [Undibacterium sp. CCC2.1]MEB0173391.1 ABC transporter substrate-binding protein [Undibacterium sp. CCC1.1]MEB0176788.1 ABC transporter substrate-binding protein [Undibacterium sp. CCC3.4]MEB0216555.1 ABC transporter substrate-binding protein [Undibacterium sp. 5I2]WPX43391.1 ABC transporter substrate-binding protein [Undibacterium sp. CCC3.4]